MTGVLKRVFITHVDNGVEFNVKTVARIIECNRGSVMLKLNRFDKGTPYHGIKSIRVEPFTETVRLAYRSSNPMIELLLGDR